MPSATCADRERSSLAAGPGRRLGLWITLLLTACGAREPDLSWRNLDLWRSPPTLVEGVPAATVELRLRPLLGDELRQPPGPGRKTPRNRHAGEVHTVEAPAGARLGWSVDLAAAASFSFLPLADARPDCSLRYRVLLGVGEEEPLVLHDHLARPTVLAAAAEIAIDLGAFADRRVDLLVDSTAVGGGCGDHPPRAIWGSPRIVERAATSAWQGSVSPPNLLLIGLDTLRADALAAYGRQPSLTPEIDRLAAQSDVWLEAFANFNVTNPSFASLMTGLYGKNHGIYDLSTPLPAEHQTLAELLRAAGYQTGAILSARHLGDRQSGLGQGFDGYHVPPRQYAAEVVVDESIAWISSRTRPFFLWLHLFDPHIPHTAPQPYASGFRPQRAFGLEPVRAWSPYRQPGPLQYRHKFLGGHEDLYDAEVAYTDRHLGRLLAFLESRGLLATTLIALVADHGENLGDHGVLFRHSGLWDTTTHVPLMIRWPGRERLGRRLPGLVQTLDLFPTLLAAAGVTPPASDGQLLARGGEGQRRLVFAEHSQDNGAMVRSREYLYMRLAGHSVLADGARLYDLRQDPAQNDNLAGRGLAAEETLAGYLDAWLGERRQAIGVAPTPLDATDLEQLRALGYLGGGE